MKTKQKKTKIGLKTKANYINFRKKKPILPSSYQQMTVFS
jgi:hypothetical protein